VIDGSGHILTNNHVVSAAAQRLDPVLTRRARPPRAAVGRSPAYDLAVARYGLDAPSCSSAARTWRRRADVWRSDRRWAWRHRHLPHRLGQEPPGDGRREGEISYINALQTDARSTR